MPLARRVADQLSADGHDAIHLSQQGLGRLADEEIFAKARAERRIIVTPIWISARSSRGPAVRQ
jgi:predicted nuclease of predicted toxin-antitoxin system